MATRGNQQTEVAVPSLGFGQEPVGLGLSSPPETTQALCLREGNHPRTLRWRTGLRHVRRPRLRAGPVAMLASTENASVMMPPDLVPVTNLCRLYTPALREAPLLGLQ